MGRQTRTLRTRGDVFQPAATVGSSTVAVLESHGVHVLSTAVAVDFVLAPPTLGATVVLYNAEATTGVLVRANPKGVSTVTINASTALSFIEFDGAGDKAVTLVATSTTNWIVTAITPISTALNLAASS